MCQLFFLFQVSQATFSIHQKPPNTVREDMSGWDQALQNSTISESKGRTFFCSIIKLCLFRLKCHTHYAEIQAEKIEGSKVSREERKIVRQKELELKKTNKRGGITKLAAKKL